MCENNEINCPQEMMDLICENGTEHLENYRKNIVTKISYLIGVDEKTLENGSFVLEEIDKLRANEDATIIRNLCILRTQFFRNYLGIRKARQNFERIDKLDGFFQRGYRKLCHSRSYRLASCDRNRGGSKESFVEELYLSLFAVLLYYPASELFKKSGAGHKDQKSEYFKHGMHYRYTERICCGMYDRRLEQHNRHVVDRKQDQGRYNVERQMYD